MSCQTCGEHLCVKSGDGVSHRWIEGCLEIFQNTEESCGDGPCGPQVVAGCLELGQTSLFLQNECVCPKLYSVIFQATGTGEIEGSVYIDNQPVLASSSSAIPKPATGTGGTVTWIANYVLQPGQVIQVIPSYSGVWPKVHFQIVSN